MQMPSQGENQHPAWSVRMLRPAAWNTGTPTNLVAGMPASSYSCGADECSGHTARQSSAASSLPTPYVQRSLDFGGLWHELHDDLRLVRAARALALRNLVDLADTKPQHTNR